MSLEEFKMRDVLDKITLGVLQSLEQHLGVEDVKIMDQKPADQSIVDAWEQKYMCKLPKELKSFYQTTDGMLIQWSVSFKGGIVQLGSMEINSVASLTKLTTSKSSKSNDGPTLADIDCDFDEEDNQGHTRPHFDDRNRVYELDSCNGNGKVCLVYKDLKAGFTTSIPEIWFLDRALQWYYLSDNFLSYFRMMMIHLGLPCWQYLFTDTGLSPQTKVWFHLYAPERLEAVKDGGAMSDDDIGNQTNTAVNRINTQRVFKNKVEKKKASNEQSKSRTQGAVGKTKSWNSKQFKSVSRSQLR
eukprot:Seg729.16 transcript_id=Seg729.16/GoldUCD/mRNA.D3Y31 product="Tubulin polyglutamylase complex subunit 2" protein_id=Seg729.16/GoldUCD/D3Y31